MAAVLGFAICQLSSLTDEFLAITPSRGWMGVTIVNDSAADLTLATNPEDAMTEVLIAAGTQFSIQAIMAGGAAALRFQAGQPAFYLKTATGDGAGAYIVWA